MRRIILLAIGAVLGALAVGAMAYTEYKDVRSILVVAIIWGISLLVTLITTTIMPPTAEPNDSGYIILYGLFAPFVLVLWVCILLSCRSQLTHRQFHK
jgi:hypothetical protein